MEIWERNRDWAALEEEARRRNEGAIADSVAVVNNDENEELQSNFPKIWGVEELDSSKCIDFSIKAEVKKSQKEFARICSRKTRWSSEFHFRMLGFNEV